MEGSTIPIEVLNLIFSHLNNRGLSQCLLVCKNWNVVASVLVYKELRLNAYKVYILKRLLKLSPEDRKSHFKNGVHTKKLIIANDNDQYIQFTFPKDFDVKSLQASDYEFDNKEFIALLEYLPNIQHLDLGPSSYYDKYMQYILDTESVMCLKHIQVITKREDSFSFLQSRRDNNFAVCYKYRTTIKSLQIEYESKSVNLGSQDSTLLPLLSDFIKLSELKLVNTCDDELTTIDISRLCPNLNSLNYISDHEVPEERVKNLLAASGIVNRNLKDLNITVPTVEKNYAHYITEHLDQNMDNVHLEISEMDQCDWINHLGMENALKLARRLSTLKNASIFCRPDKYYERSSSGEESDTTVFFTFLNAFKGERKAYCRASYDDFRSMHKSMSYNLDYGFRYSYGLDYSDYYPQYESEQSSKEIEIAFPDLSLSTTGPEIVNHMNITMCDSNPELPSKFLEYALCHCPYLDHFEYKCLNLDRPEIHICADAEKLSGGKEMLPETITQNNMKVLKTVDYVPSKDMLKVISTQLPNIELYSCAFRYSKSNEIDLTCFKNLKMFYFNNSWLSTCTFFHIIYGHGSEYYYQQDKRSDSLSLTTLEQVQQELESSNDSRLYKIRCDKDTTIVVCFYHILIAEITNGELLDHINLACKIPLEFIMR